MTAHDCDMAIVGGGLAGGLIALAVAHRRPDLTVRLFEAGPTVGGNHRWSWFAADLSPAGERLMAPLSAIRWDNGYTVNFPARRRTLATPYRSLASRDFAADLARQLPRGTIRTNCRVADFDAHAVTLAGGERITARAVLDCRAFTPSVHLSGGWQAFVGHHLRTDRAHGVERPMIMDASVPQGDAFRFVYVLPLGARELLIEDTCYQTSSSCDDDAFARRIARYAAEKGWTCERLGMERGMLPVVTGGNFEAWQAERRIEGVARAGAHAGFLHPLTGYTLPFAVETALAVADNAGLPGPDLAALLERLARDHWRATRFYRHLGSMLLGAARPDGRWHVFDRFYRLSRPLIERFYAARGTRLDRLRVLCGKPPVPPIRALHALASSRPPAAERRMTPEGRRACVIGAGFGGLALAIRLQAAGVRTTVVEARDQPGGRAYYWRKDGFTFDAGPTVITDPACLRQLWELTGHDIADDIELVPVSPFYRLNWPDGTNFDYSNDRAALTAQIARLSPEDIAGYDQFLAYSAAVYEEGYVKLGAQPFLDFKSMVQAAPALMKQQAWRSVYAMVAKFVGHEKLRQALSFHTLLVGGSPFTTSAIYALIHKLEQAGGVWWPRGGTNRLVAAMVRHFERLGGTVRLSDPVVQVHTLGTRATEVETGSSWRERFDAVASNGDIVHSYGGLLAGSPRGPQMARRLAKKRFSPSLFVVHFGIEGTWPGVPHHTILFGPRYEGLLKDIYDHGVLPTDFSIYLHHPTVTDPSMAPEGKSTFYALVPVAHLGKLAIDWTEVGPVLEKRVLDEVARRLIPDLHDRLVTKFHYTPSDFAGDLNAHLGSAFSLEPILTQSAWFRGHNRDDVIGNFYLVGAGTHPGAGIPGVVASAKATAGLMLEDLAR